MIFPVTFEGITYYHLDHNQNRSAEAGANSDSVTHDALNDLLNEGNATAVTQTVREHDGRDDARSAIVGNYVLILPTRAELQRLRRDSSDVAPLQWVNGAYWSATPSTAGRFFFLSFASGTSGGQPSTTAFPTAFQVLPFVSATPVFRETIEGQLYVYTVSQQVALTLPEAFGGTAPLTYTLTRLGNPGPELPDGLTFNADPMERTISGASTQGFATTGSAGLRYTATDANGAVASTDFRLRVNNFPTFDTSTILAPADDIYTRGTPITSLLLPPVTNNTGTGPLTVSLTPIPEGLIFDPSERTLAGTPSTGSLATDLTYTITDANAVAISLTFTVAVNASVLSIEDVVVNEGDGVAVVTVNSRYAVSGGFSVDVTTKDGTATAGLDYTAVNRRTLAFNSADDNEMQTFTVTINDDSATENDETLTVSLDNLEQPQPTGGGVDISDGATIRILANDAPATSDVLDLGRHSDINLRLIFPATFDGKTYYHLDHNPNGLSDNSADNVTHITLNNLLNGGNSTEDTLPGGHDGRDDARSAIAENYVVILPTEEEFRALTNGQSPPGKPRPDWNSQYWTSTPGVVANTFVYHSLGGAAAIGLARGFPGSTVFQVLPYVSSIPVFSETIANQIYPIGKMVELTLPEADTGRTTPLTYTLTPTADIPNGLTFNAADRVLTGTPDMATTVTLTYTATDSSDTPTSAALTFMVTVPPYPIVSIDNVAVDEGAGAATVTVSVDVAVAGGFTVNASTANDTAFLDEDYTAVTNQMLTFDDTATDVTFDVPIIDDAVVEGTETLMVSLLQVTGTTVTLPTAPATVTINDDDTASLTLTPATLTVTEGGIATFTVSVNAAVQGAFMVDASTVNGTATSAQDYTAVTSRTLTFTGTADEPQTFTVAITNDMATEGAETLTVLLDNLEPPLAGIDISARATITIMENDPSDEFLELGIHDDSGINLDLIFPVMVGGVTYYHLDHNQNRSAESGAHPGGDGVSHNALNRLLNDGNPTANTQGRRTHDGRDDARSVIVGNYVLILPTLEELLSLHDDFFARAAPPSWVSGVYWSASPQGSSFLSLNLSNREIRTLGRSTALSTAFQVLPFVSATPVFRETINDQDYTAGQQVELTLPEAFGGTGLLSYTLTPTLSIPDGLTFNAADRTLTGTLAAVTVTTTVALTYTVTDSADTPTSTALTFMVTVSPAAMVSIADVDVNEGDGVATVIVSVDNMVPGGFMVAASTDDDTARAGQDYTAVNSQTLVFNGEAGETQTFTVTINDDTATENDETLTVSLDNLHLQN